MFTSYKALVDLIKVADEQLIEEKRIRSDSISLFLSLPFLSFSFFFMARFDLKYSHVVDDRHPFLDVSSTVEWHFLSPSIITAIPST